MNQKGSITDRIGWILQSSSSTVPVFSDYRQVETMHKDGFESHQHWEVCLSTIIH